METNLANSLPAAWQIIEKGIRDGMHLGGQLYISKSGGTVIETAFGMRQPGVLMHPDDLMLWLSNTKPFMAVAFGQLLETNRISLADPIAKWIPEFGAEAKETITIEHLLTHTGGFRGADKISEQLSWAATIHEICATPLEPDWVPGKTAGYHISGSWFILGEILQHVTGADLANYFRQNLFLRLDMENSHINLSFSEFENAIKRIAPVFITSSGKSELHPILNSPEYIQAARPGSSGRGPIRELAHFYEMLLNDGTGGRGKFLNPDTVQNLTNRRRIGLVDRTFRHVIDWGLGFIVNSNQYGTETVPYSFGRHASPETFGHGGAQSSSAFADPEHDLVVAWAFNGMPGEARHNQRGRELNSAIYQDLGLATE